MRKIIHCDCDCFYASVEMRDDPSLRGRPLAVGGRPDQRGVIATCNYEARAFGVRSAMSSSVALRLCPALLILRPEMEKYRQASRRIMAIYRDYTPLVEPLSLDEAFLDVSDSPHHQGSATRIAMEIRARIAAEVGVTASAGVAPNKFLAKIASDINKPDGLFVLRPEEVDAFVERLPVGKLFGVGRVTERKLHAMGAQTCGDLRAWSQEALTLRFGRFGQRLFELSRGIDVREVNPSRVRKSVSVETTFAVDLPDLPACQAQVAELYAQLGTRLARAGVQGRIRGLHVKLRFSDFRTTTIECAGAEVAEAAYRTLLDTAYARRSMPVRLIGLGVRLGPAVGATPSSAAAAGAARQAALFDDA